MTLVVADNILTIDPRRCPFATYVEVVDGDATTLLEDVGGTPLHPRHAIWRSASGLSSQFPTRKGSDLATHPPNAGANECMLAADCGDPRTHNIGCKTRRTYQKPRVCDFD